MHVYREDVYFFLGGIHDGKDKKDNFIMYRHVAFFLKGGKQKYPNLRKDSLQSPNVVGWDGGWGCEVPITYNYFIVLKLISLYFIFLHVTKRGNSFKILVSTCKLKKGEGHPTYDATCLIYTIAI